MDARWVLIVKEAPGETGSWGEVLKMIDFGVACLVEQDQLLQEQRGTLWYVAPEVRAKSQNTLFSASCFEFPSNSLIFIHDIHGFLHRSQDSAPS